MGSNERVQCGTLQKNLINKLRPGKSCWEGGGRSLLNENMFWDWLICGLIERIPAQPDGNGYR